MKVRFQLKKKKLSDFLIKHKVWVGLSLRKTHPTQYPFLMGSRPNSFTLINLWFLKRSVRFFFRIFVALQKNDLPFIIFYNFNNKVLVEELKQEIRRHNNISFVADSNVENYNIIRRNSIFKKQPVIFSFFLSSNRLLALKKAAFFIKAPVVSFSDTSSSFFYSDKQILGNFSKTNFQNSLVALILLCLKKIN